MLTPKGIAHLLNMPLSWIYERTRRGEIPGFKVGKYWRFREEEVLAWFEQFRRGPQPSMIELQSARGSEVGKSDVLQFNVDLAPEEKFHIARNTSANKGRA
jgi:excisionase family DNA binding protein